MARFLERVAAWPVIIGQDRNGFFNARWYTNAVGTPIEGKAAPSIPSALRALADALDVEGRRQEAVLVNDIGDTE